MVSDNPLSRIATPLAGAVLPINGKFRAECLNAHWFMSLDDARSKMEQWRRDYNEVRPHSAIGNNPPAALQTCSRTSVAP